MPENFIDGEWVAAQEGGHESRCPANDRLADQDLGGTHTGVRTEAAIAGSARRASTTGAGQRTSARERGDLLLRVADLLQRDRAELARHGVARHRQALRGERDRHRRRRPAFFRHFGLTADAEAGRVVDTGRADVDRQGRAEPVGVCGLITPWNYPLLQIVWKVAPASRRAHLRAQAERAHPAHRDPLMRLLAEAGLPDGVANLVSLRARRPVRPCARTPASTWCRSPAASRPASRSSRPQSGTVKKVALELGGKNPNIVFADADRETRPWTWRSPRSSCTPDRSARPARG